MATLINQLKASSESVVVVTDYNGKNVEMTITIGGLVKYLEFDHISSLAGLTDELQDATRTIINELNQSDFKE